MNQEPVTVTYSIEEVLKEINRKLEKINTIEVEIAKISEKVENIDNRLKNVEGTQKSQVWALIVLLAEEIATASARLFFLANP